MNLSDESTKRFQYFDQPRHSLTAISEKLSSTEINNLRRTFYAQQCQDQEF